jgi:membrane protein DedA with SNARE-associated domain
VFGASPLGPPLTLLVACLASGLVIPVPEDVALLLAGWQIRQGELSIFGALAAGMLGTLGRDAIAFTAGRVFGPAIERVRFLHRLGVPRRVGWARAKLERHGSRMLFLTRFLVGVRAPLYFAGGSLGFPTRRFVLLDLVGLCLTVPVTLAIGHAAGVPAVDGLTAALAHQRAAIATLLLLAALWFGAIRPRRRPKPEV